MKKYLKVTDSIGETTCISMSMSPDQNVGMMFCPQVRPFIPFSVVHPNAANGVGVICWPLGGESDEKERWVVIVLISWSYSKKRL